MQRGRKSKIENTIELISVPDFASKTGYSKQVIYDWIRKGEIEGFICDGGVKVKADQTVPPQ
jgi:transposase